MGVSTNTQVTGGLGAFTVIFLLALAVWFLGRNLTTRLRRMDYRERDRQAAADRGEAPAPDGPVTGTPLPPDPDRRR